jgi:hypothetical protein
VKIQLLDVGRRGGRDAAFGEGVVVDPLASAVKVRRVAAYTWIAELGAVDGLAITA